MNTFILIAKYNYKFIDKIKYMSKSKIELFILSLLLFSQTILINCNNDDDDLKLIIEDYETNVSQLKLISCLNILHSFLSQRDGDQKLKKMIKNSNYPHDKLYIKYITSSIKKCSDKINSNQISYLLTPENFDNYNTLNSSITNLIKLNEDINNVELTNDEQYIYDKISKQIIEQEQKYIKKKKKKGFYQEHKPIIIAILIIIGSILFYMRYMRKTTKDDKNKNNVNNTKEINKKQYRKKKKN